MQYLTLLISIVFLAHNAHAQIYRCFVDKQTVYQDHPCGSVNTAIVKPSHQANGLRDSEKNWIKQNKRKAPAPNNKPTKRTEYVETKACWKKRQQLKAVKRQLKQGYKASEGDKLKRERAKYQDFLKRFCQN